MSAEGKIADADGQDAEADGQDADAKVVSVSNGWPVCPFLADITMSKEIATDSGTITIMLPHLCGVTKVDSVGCIDMWGELNDANDGMVTNCIELTDIWYRNLHEYATTGTVGPGRKLPFAVQFFTPGWFPEHSEAILLEMRGFFCQLDEAGALRMTKYDFYELVKSYELVKTDKAWKDNISLKGMHSNTLHPIKVQPLYVYISSAGYRVCRMSFNTAVVVYLQSNSGP